MRKGFANDDVHSESGTSTMGRRVVVGLISTLSEPFTFENIVTPSDWEE